MNLAKCDRPGCTPRRYTREGADHIGLDLFVKCDKCQREGPYVEVIKPTPTTRELVDNGWNKDLAGQEQTNDAA